jgi:copper chaperone
VIKIVTFAFYLFKMILKREGFMKFIVDNMSCQHCVKTITKAINDIDPKAKVTVDLAKHEVDIENSTISQEAVIVAIDKAGFQFVGVAFG